MGLYPNVGFNVSPRQLRRPDVARRFAEVVQRPRHRGRAASCSRSPSRHGRSRPRGCCRCSSELRAAGFALAIDDFGAGYSSLWRLRELPVQIIKVDRAFLHGVPDDPQATAVYSAILRLADACGCDVVAEGVEEAEHAAFLVDERLPDRPGLPLQPAGAGPDVHGAAGGVDRLRAPALTNVNCGWVGRRGVGRPGLPSVT